MRMHLPLWLRRRTGRAVCLLVAAVAVVCLVAVLVFGQHTTHSGSDDATDQKLYERAIQEKLQSGGKWWDRASLIAKELMRSGGDEDHPGKGDDDDELNLEDYEGLTRAEMLALYRKRFYNAKKAVKVPNGVQQEQINKVLVKRQENRQFVQELVDRLKQPKTLSQLPFCSQLLHQLPEKFSDNSAKLSAQQLALSNLSRHWREFMQQRALMRHETTYCLAQCHPGRCCTDTSRKARSLADSSWYTIVHDSTQDVHDATGFSGVTLVTTGTLDRIHVLERIVKRWEGPLVAVFATRYSDDETRAAADAKLETLKALAATWEQTTIVVVKLQHRHDYYTEQFEQAGEPDARPLIPLNTLRNIAVALAPTNFVFTCDMDFIPSLALHYTLSELTPILAQVDRAAVVVPHWETLDCGEATQIPKTFEQLMTMARSGLVRPFHADFNQFLSAELDLSRPAPQCEQTSAEWTPGIETTNYLRWIRESELGVGGMYPIPVEGPLTDIAYEPFVLVKQVESSHDRLPPYKEKYVGRFKNKISFVTTLRAFHYKFFVLRQEFIAHLAHPSKPMSDAMLGHMEAMQHLHALERQQLFDTVFNATDTIPTPKPSFLDEHGISCLRDH
eukprot:m.5126 g.5126  ORF g.5126 m.5126 type:complete len:617 (-) comp4837_c0_seq1:209-2059(-)